MVKKSYSQFILEKVENEILNLIEESVFVMSDNLYDILKEISGGDGDRQPESSDPAKKIAAIFIRLELEDIDDKTSYLDISDDNQTIKFLDADKADKYRKSKSLTIKQLFSDTELNRNNIRVGRLVRKVIELYNKKFNKDLEFTDADIEAFVNKYKAYHDYSVNKMSNFKILKGNQIPDAYLIDNYSSDKGTLGHSCMRYEECQSYFDLYTQSDSCSLLVLYCPDKKVSGRALLWEAIDGSKIMDRVYTNKDSDVELFNKWAIDNGYFKRLNMLEFSDGVNRKQLNFTIKTYKIDLVDSKYENFPYLDTFKYYYFEEGVIRNYGAKEGYYVYLDDTEGYVLCRRCDECGTEECDNCVGYVYLEDDTKCPKCNNGVIKCTRCGGFADRFRF